MAKQKEIAGIAFFSLMGGTTFGLGCWQTQRYQWKKQLIAEREDQLAQPEVSLDEHRRMFHRVKLEGKIHFDKMCFVGPRTSPIDTNKSAMMQQGFYLIAPFVTKDQTVAMNFGWTSHRGAHPQYLWNELRAKLESKPMKIVALDDNVEASGPAHESIQHLHWFDQQRMDEIFRVKDIRYMVAVEDLALPGLTQKSSKDFVKFRVTPEVHVGYAITWYGFALSCMYVMKKRFL